VQRLGAEDGIMLPRVTFKTARIITYADASFANNRDLTSQLGYVCFLIDDGGNCAALAYKSLKARRVTRSVLAAETLAFSEAYDTAYMYRRILEQLHGLRFPITMLTDSKSLFDVITRASYTTEKRIMIDLAAAREAYEREELSDIGLVASENNLADGLTKPNKAAQDRLQGIITSGRHTPIVRQYVIRKRAVPQERTEPDRGSVSG
jgi:hypothetical protein